MYIAHGFLYLKYLKVLISTEHEIRIEKCSDTCPHKIKVVLTFSKNGPTLGSFYSLDWTTGLEHWTGLLD